MKLFSQRKGIKSVKTMVQVKSMDYDLRVSLWNALTVFYWARVTNPRRVSDSRELAMLCKELWVQYFKRAVDTLTNYWNETYSEIREYFFDCEWFEVYDLIEFVSKNYPDPFNSVNPQFMNHCNSILEKEVSAYRFVGGEMTQITSEEEIAEIEEALKAPKPLEPVANHLKTALHLLADKKSPDYRNSIKESISAVEAICKLITSNPKVKLGQALREIEDKVGLHPALKSGFSSLYGYTSNAQGIRHALLDESDLSFEDAKFMLVSCSAFVNYLTSKSSKAGIRVSFARQTRKA